MSANSSRMRSAIACSSPVGLGIETRSTASPTKRPGSISTEMWKHLLAEELDLIVSPVAPQLEHDVRAPCVPVLLDCRDAIRRRARDRLALVEDLVGHLRLGGEASALLHCFGHRPDLLLRQAGEIEQRVRRAL